MVVESVDAADLTTAVEPQQTETALRDALKVGELSVLVRRDNAEPSSANRGEGVETGRARPT